MDKVLKDYTRLKEENEQLLESDERSSEQDREIGQEKENLRLL